MNTKWLKYNLVKNKSKLDISENSPKGFRYSNQKLELKIKEKKQNKLLTKR